MHQLQQHARSSCPIIKKIIYMNYKKGKKCKRRKRKCKEEGMNFLLIESGALKISHVMVVLVF